jgi:hypothetical protein
VFYCNTPFDYLKVCAHTMTQIAHSHVDAGFGVLTQVRSSSSLAVSMAAGVRRPRRQIVDDGDDSDCNDDARQWVMPALLSATRCAAASWPAIATIANAGLVARWRRVWAFDALAAPAGMMSRLIIETMQFDRHASVLAIWRSGVEVMLSCGASRYDSDDDSQNVQHRFAAALVYDVTSADNTLLLDIYCWRVTTTVATTAHNSAFDTPQSLLLRLTQIVERALLDISEMSEPVQRIVMYVVVSY